MAFGYFCQTRAGWPPIAWKCDGHRTRIVLTPATEISGCRWMPGCVCDFLVASWLQLPAKQILLNRFRDPFCAFISGMREGICSCWLVAAATAVTVLTCCSLKP